MRESKKENRTCKCCGKIFSFFTCYAKRPGNPGSFCSKECRGKSQYGKNNPNISELSEELGVAQAKSYKQKQRYLNIRRQTIDLLSPDGRRCCNCGCDNFELLQINHIYGGGSSRKESGVMLWRMVLKLAEEAKKYFDVRCVLCNWLYALQKKHETKYEIVWKNI